MMKFKFDKKKLLVPLYYLSVAKQKVIKFTKAVGRRAGWYILRTKKWKWDHRLYKILKTVPQNKHNLYKAVLTSQHNYEEQCKDSAAYTQINIDSVAVAKQILDQLVIMDIVGVQPMQGPVSLNYLLRLIDREDKDGESRMTLEIISKAVEAQTRKLATSWTIEAAQDLSIHGIDIESEIIQAVAAEIAHEITTEHLANLRKLAKKMPIKECDTNNLIVHINYAANEIARETRRGAGNFIVVSMVMWAKMFDYVRNTPSLNFEPGEKNPTMGPLLHVGTILGNIRIYSDLHGEDDKILVGYKGKNSETDTGYYFSPYIMLLSAGVVVDPETYAPKLGLMTRRGITTTDDSENYYRELVIE